MSVIKIENIKPVIYIILGVDKHEHDQVIGVAQTYEDAKEVCIHFEAKTDFYDLWIEKHPLM